MLAQGSPMVEDLLRISAGKALVHDGYFTSHLHATSLPTAIIPDIATLRKISRCRLDDLPLVDDEEVAMIFHTSGTTSGRPKPVPQTHRWLKCQSKVNWPGAWQGGDLDIQKCFNNLGSFGNVGSATAINYLAPSGQCIIQTSRPDFDAAELLAMVREGLNNILLYANWLSKLLAIARSDNQVLDALCSVQQIAYTGEALNPEDLRWALENNIPLTVIYATTETGKKLLFSSRVNWRLIKLYHLAICLVSDLHDPQTLPSMRLIDGMDCEFLPRCMDEQEQLFDLFVPSGAGNCPHARVRNRPDGHITGDLFEATRHGYYIFRSLHRAIEDNVKLTCADIVQNCVVVGSYKPIILFVEPSRSFANNAEGDSGALKDQLLKRMEEFNKSRFMHERIDSPLRIVVVSAGSLPRTKEKGNIRYTSSTSLSLDPPKPYQQFSGEKLSKKHTRTSYK
ncbi:hypothetical protein H0H87_006596 [Tephrocybe sp. NHM501043]|nr:hypothetical protein H0H87_006596 [Tephrocybe sp. NHM501043]